MRARKELISSGVGMVALVTMVAVISLVVMIPGANGDLSPSQCKEEKRLLTNSCRPVIFGRKPSAECCQRVREAHVECVCPSVTTKLAALIGVKRAIRGIQGCGRPVPPNFRCGSILSCPFA